MAVPCATVCRPGSTRAVGRLPAGRAVGRVGATCTSTRTRFSSLAHTEHSQQSTLATAFPTELTEPQAIQNIDVQKMMVTTEMRPQSVIAWSQTRLEALYSTISSL